MKASEITIKEVAVYLKLDLETMTEQEIAELSAILASSKAFIKDYTGLDDSSIDTHEALSMVLMVLCQTQHDNRSYVLEKTSLNPFIQSTLNMYCINFL